MFPQTTPSTTCSRSVNRCANTHCVCLCLCLCCRCALAPMLQACNRMSYECVPLYDTLGENAVEFIINHSGAVVTIVDGRKLGSLAGAVKGINTELFKHVVYWGKEDAAAVQVRMHAQARRQTVMSVPVAAG